MLLFTASHHITTITYISAHSLNNNTPNGLECQLCCRPVFEIYLVRIPKRPLVIPLIILQHLSSNSGTLHAPGREGVLPINFQLIIILLTDTTHSELLKPSLKGQRKNKFSLYASKSSFMECGVMAPHILLHHYSGNTILVL